MSNSGSNFTVLRPDEPTGSADFGFPDAAYYLTDSGRFRQEDNGECAEAPRALRIPLHPNRTPANPPGDSE